MDLLSSIVSAIGAVIAAVVGALAFHKARHADNELRNGTSDQLDRIEATQARHGQRLDRIEPTMSQLATGQTQLATLVGNHIREAEQQWRKENPS